MNTKTTGGGTATPGPCPDLETLASFVDGNLTAAERTRVVEHLADCARCAETVAEAMQILGEAGLEEETVEDDETGETDPATALIPPPALVLPFRRWAVVALPLAAAAALAVALWPAGFGGKSWVGEEMARRAGGGEAGRTLGTGWGGLRTFRSPSEVPGEAAALRVGVLSVDLAAAIAAGDRAAAVEFAHRAASELDAVGAMAAPGFAQFAEGLEAESLAGAAAQAAQLEKEAGLELDEAEFSLGKWAEAGRLAAKLGNEEYFNDRRTLRQAKALLRQDLSADHRERLGAIADELATDRPDLATLAPQFERLVRSFSA